jgi:hypothetical protein
MRCVTDALAEGHCTTICPRRESRCTGGTGMNVTVPLGVPVFNQALGVQ